MGEKTNSLAVFAVAYDCGKSRSAGESGPESFEGRELLRCSERGHIVLVFCLTWKAANSYCKPGALPRLTGVIKGRLALCHREPTRRPPRLTWRRHPHQIKLHLFMEQISTQNRLANFREKSSHLKVTKENSYAWMSSLMFKNLNQYGNAFFHPNLFVDLMTN